MIQRIQTVYLTASVIACVLLFTFPMAKFNNDVQGIYILSAIGIKYLNMVDPPIFVNFWLTFPMLILSIASIILTAVAIPLYKKRKSQLILVNISFLLNIILIALVYLYYTGYVEKLSKVLPSYQFGIFLPIISMVMLVLANRAIRKDEALVKSVDRLR
jgi:hypothetical protein